MKRVRPPGAHIPLDWSENCATSCYFSTLFTTTFLSSFNSLERRHLTMIRYPMIPFPLLFCLTATPADIGSCLPLILYQVHLFTTLHIIVSHHLLDSCLFTPVYPPTCDPLVTNITVFTPFWISFSSISNVLVFADWELISCSSVFHVCTFFAI